MISVKSEIFEGNGKNMTKLTPAMQRFILHWGEMGSTWGLNRTVAQIYAMLYLSPNPLTADEICETLSLARSTVSTGLHELQGWGVIRVVHVLGDRRDHFEYSAGLEVDEPAVHRRHGHPLLG